MAVVRFGLFVAALAAVAISGCGNRAGGGTIQVPNRWVDEVISRVVSWVEDGTGVVIEKGDVKIESQGTRKDSTSGGHISDFKINVSYRKTEFSSTPKDIPCSIDGIPTDEGNARIKASIEEIKNQIKKMR